MNEIKLDIREISLGQLKDFFIEKSHKSFRAAQVWEWIWKHRVLNFDKMTNLSLKHIQCLKKHYTIKKINILEFHISSDGTVKFLFELESKKVVEGVLIPQRNRLTACISSQAGCSLACTFCATGQIKLHRNLNPGEIYDQVFFINQYAVKHFKKPLTNIVYMGMGEPFLNYKNVLKSIHYITSSFGMAMSYKRITVSTVGITKIIKKIADEGVKFNLAISLHSASNTLRSKLMDINKTNDLDSLLNSLIYFYDKTRIKPTYEYVLLSGVNDSEQDAKLLVKFCKKNPCKVNLIEYNKVANSIYEKSTNLATIKFIKLLEKNNILVKFRRSRGADVNAACGQLANKIN
ncbi:MAG: 23S rRNA (adenine(2503)-C(2))-methyltransferase RlmN [Flavobacteriales bacterium]|nr:23S rRNA (adenine(2503)-C(2))-methyltransferase RlmN [Flavobacteriales bacterium]|tara:strand:+ start:18457 stop:19500 length:1044 start_codon:yes stop_codon:yes gene_type:complete